MDAFPLSEDALRQRLPSGTRCVGAPRPQQHGHFRPRCPLSEDASFGGAAAPFRHGRQTAMDVYEAFLPP